MKFKSAIILLVFFLDHYYACFGKDEISKIQNLVFEWNEAHNNKDINKFQKLFAQNVLFYAKDISKESCIDKKYNLLKSASKFKQVIASGISITYFDSGLI